MKLQTKNYEPVDTTIWLDYDPDEILGGSKLVLPHNTKLPPFVHATVLAAGPACKQVKDGDLVLVNSSTITRIKVGQEPDVFFTKEAQVVAIVKNHDITRNGVGDKVIEFHGATD